MSLNGEPQRQAGGAGAGHRPAFSHGATYLTVTYTVTEQDLYEHYRHANTSDPKRKTRIWFAYVILLLGTFWAFSATLPLPQLVLLELVVAMLAVPLYYGLLRLRIRERIRDVPAVIGDEMIAIFPEGLRTVSELGEVKFKWSEITRVEAIPGQILIGTDRHNTLLIPRRAFPSTEAAEAFLEAAQSWHTTAHQSTTH
jgi:hypothetical protein